MLQKNLRLYSFKYAERKTFIESLLTTEYIFFNWIAK